MTSSQHSELALEAPEPQALHDLASTVVRTLRAAQGQLQEEREAVRAAHARLAADRDELAQSQTELTRLHQDIESRFSDLAQAGRQLDELRAEVETARKECDHERLVLCGERVKTSPPAEDSQDLVVPYESSPGRVDRRVAATVGASETASGSVVPPSPASPYGPAPKPASSTAAQQFRKLRRDAKRRAVGV